MKHFWITKVFFLLSTITVGQSENFVFLDLNKVLKDLKDKNKNSEYYNNLDCRGWILCVLYK
jgi:hypothetical protein